VNFSRVVDGARNVLPKVVAAVNEPSLIRYDKNIYTKQSN